MRIPRWAAVLAIVALVIVAGLVVVQVLVREMIVRRAEHMGPYQVSIGHIAVAPNAFWVGGLRVADSRNGQTIVTVQEAKVRFDLHSLLHGPVHARVWLDRPQLLVRKNAEGRPVDALALRRSSRRSRPEVLDSFDVRDGVVRFHLRKLRHDVVLRDVTVHATNISNRPAPPRELPMAAQAEARLGRTGALHLSLRAAPSNRPPAAQFRLAAASLPLTMISREARAKTGIEVSSGTLSFVVEGSTANDHYRARAWVKASAPQLAGGTSPTKEIKKKAAQMALKALESLSAHGLAKTAATRCCPDSLTLHQQVEPY